MGLGATRFFALCVLCVIAVGCSGDDPPPVVDAVTTVSFGELPSVVVEHGGFMWALDRRGGGLAKIDPDTDRVVDTFELSDGTNTRARDDVWDLVASDDSLWLTAPAARSLLKVDPETGAVDRVESGAFVSDIYSASGSLWFQRGGNIVRVDGETGRVEGKIPFPGDQPRISDLVEYEDSVWIVRDDAKHVAGSGALPTYFVSGELWQIDPGRMRVIDKTPLGSSYSRGAINPVVWDVEVAADGLWMSRPYEGRLLLVEPFTGEVLLQFPIAAFELTWELAVVDGELWAGDLNGDQVMWIDPESRDRELFEVPGETSYVGGGFGSAWVPLGGAPPMGDASCVSTHRADDRRTQRVTGPRHMHLLHDPEARFLENDRDRRDDGLGRRMR